MNTTTATKKTDLQINWHLIDAKGKVLGRIATEIASLLVGKHKVDYAPYLNCGDKVVVINAKFIELTRNKELNKVYYRHSGTVGNLKTKTVKQLREHNPNKIILTAVKGMLPKNRLQNDRLANLYIYEGPEHKQQAQLGGKSDAK